MSSKYLDNYLIDAFVELLRSGFHENMACDMLGVRKATYHSWKTKGEEEEGTIYEEFLDQVQKAKAEAYKKVINSITTAIPDNPQLAMKWMETRYGKQMGKPGFADGDDDPSIKIAPPAEQSQINTTNIILLNLQEKLINSGLISEDTLGNLFKKVTEKKEPVEEEVIDTTFADDK